MKNSVCFFIIVLTSCLSFGSIDYITRFSGDSVTFELQDHINFEAYASPRTLIGCDVDFSEVDVKAEQLWLFSDTAKAAIDFQLSDVVYKNGKLQKAKVNFFADLPAGAIRRFRLENAGNALMKVRYDHEKYNVKVNNKGDYIELDTGLVTIAMPTKKITLNEGVCGPIAYMMAGDKKMGASYILSQSLEITSVAITPIEKGKLFCQYDVVYTFTGGARYKVNIRAIAGYEHIEFTEDISELTPDDKVKLEMRWDNFNPVYRFSNDCEWFRKHDGTWRGIDEPLMTSWIEEDPHWSPGWREDPSKEMVMRVLSFSGNGVREAAPFASFWEGDDTGSRELSVFVLDHLKWQDNEYKVWQPSQKLVITFRYTDDKLYWMWPLAEGSRSTAIAVTDPVKGQAEVERIRQVYMPAFKKGYTADGRFKVDDMRLRYAQLLHQRYGCLSLDRTKNWVLEYPQTAKSPEKIFKDGHVKTADEYEDMLFRSSFIYYPLGLNVWPGIYSIQHRFVYGWATDAYGRLSDQFTPAQKKRIDALWLMAAYITAGEEMHPVRNSLSGCPNMPADGWCVPTQAAFLFPEHPMSQEWLEQYERYWEISSQMFTRPEVNTYDSKGGRWTESLSVYNWAHLRPTSFSQFAGLITDGRNRWANPFAAMRGRWMVDMLSAPIYNPTPYWRQAFGSKRKEPAPLSSEWQPGMAFDKSYGFERQYPAHGAHGTGTAIPVPPIVHVYGHYMRYYDPLLAEYMMWAGIGEDFEESKGHADWTSLMLEKYPLNNGTNPHLKSCKYTGHGIVLRAGVDTPRELSIHLDQVDRGPNYRWGNGGEGASGSIYFFANGKPYSAHERESSGDRNLDATDGVTTFGVMKDHTYRSIGFNVLEKPLYDLGVAQFAEVTSRSDKSAYSWPEYKSRTIMLVGSDYWILCDENGTLGRTACRFTWFTAKDLDFPKLIFLEPETIRIDHWTEIRTPMSKGFHRDFTLENTVLSTVLVTHRDDVEMENMTIRNIDCLEMTPVKEYRKARGFDTPKGAWRVKTANSRDIVFRSALDVRYEGKDGSFLGQAGVIRHLNNGTVELAMFKSSKVGSGDVTLAVDNPLVGVSCTIEADNSLEGSTYGKEDAVLTISGLDVAGKTFHLDGVKIAAKPADGGIAVNIPAGSHRWQFTAGHARPSQPVITDTEYLKDGVRLCYDKAAGAADYLIEISEDGGSTWNKAGQTVKTDFTLTGLETGKCHIRVIARNGEMLSVPAAEWPVYVSMDVPHYPEGLSLEIENDSIALSWGKVLGTTDYCLYRRIAGEKEVILVYKGKDNLFVDNSTGSLPTHYTLPGLEANYGKPDVKIYEYAVSAANGFGEGPLSDAISTDPSNWLNWTPAAGLKFNRRTAYWDLPYVPENQIPDEHYPD